MPTHEEWVAFYNNCSSRWVTENGVAGRRFTSKVAGYTDKSIFLPAAGWCNGKRLEWTASYGLYWSATVSSMNTNYGWILEFDNTWYVWENRHSERWNGYPVRGVLRQ